MVLVLLACLVDGHNAQALVIVIGIVVVILSAIAMVIMVEVQSVYVVCDGRSFLSSFIIRQVHYCSWISAGLVVERTGRTASMH